MNGPLPAELKFGENTVNPGAALKYFNDGGSPKDFFGCDILAKRDFFGSRKQQRDFLGIVFFISSNQK